jgi:hypothetical protein
VRRLRQPAHGGGCGAEGDQDPERQRQRGYDQHGRPQCLHGFAVSANGYDAGRRRAKYICAKAGLRQSERQVPDCPFLTANTCGQVVNVGLTMPDGSLRLARDTPCAPPTRTMVTLVPMFGTAIGRASRWPRGCRRKVRRLSSRRGTS